MAAGCMPARRIRTRILFVHGSSVNIIIYSCEVRSDAAQQRQPVSEVGSWGECRVRDALTPVGLDEIPL
ncbi:hypothetical protein RRG08_007062 [Elysia crispata]|uniref:Uncharacterized protein n=1 Tax=Elysia crispata TaxID=231223 RepID=A0AAE0XUD2_9GAST|nr:hypothetical protein RRG08_007062 [Elysia crispata]